MPKYGYPADFHMNLSDIQDVVKDYVDLNFSHDKIQKEDLINDLVDSYISEQTFAEQEDGSSIMVTGTNLNSLTKWLTEDEAQTLIDASLQEPTPKDTAQVKVFLDSLDDEMRDFAYRYLWSDYVKQDVQNNLDTYIESGDIKESSVDMIVKDVTERIVENGELDSNISYNQNIDNFINDALFLVEQKEKEEKKTTIER